MHTANGTFLTRMSAPPPMRGRRDHQFLSTPRTKKLNAHNRWFGTTKARTPSPFPSIRNPLVTLPTSDSTAIQDATPHLTREKLPNGIEVASLDTRDVVAAIGVFTGVGSRDETDKFKGASHLIQRIALKHSPTMKKVDDLGGIVTCSASHEVTLHQGDILREHTADMVQCLAEVSAGSDFHGEDLEEQRQTLPILIGEMLDDPQFFLPEVLREVAFGPDGLGNPVIVSADNLPRFEVDTLRQWVKQRVVGENMVIVGVNVDHSELVHSVSRSFGHLPKTSPVALPPRVPSLYRAGDLRLEGDPKEKVTRDPTTYVMLAWPAPSLNQPAYYGAALLHSLFGGGKNFSSGGPGKGMYTQLNTAIMNRYSWPQSVEAFNHAWTDAGLFGVLAQTEPEHSDDMVRAIISELIRSTRTIPEEAFRRAKNMLKSAINMNLENRKVLCEDIGYQLLFRRERIPADELGRKIDAFTESDLRQALRSLLSQPMSMVLHGTTHSMSRVPELKVVQDQLTRQLKK